MNVTAEREASLARAREIAQRFVSGKRFLHTLAVENEINALCKIFALDSERSYMLRIAAILHDITKEKTVAEQEKLCRKFDIPYTDLELACPKVFHALTAPELIKTEIPEFASDTVLSAIRWHTTGRAGMSLEEKLLYLADYIEATRTFSDCVKLRHAFYDTATPSDTQHLNRILLLSFDMTINGLIEEKQLIHPQTIAARNHLIMSQRI